MSQALVAAARDTGIRLTLLPVLYMTGGFDGRPLGERQKRFGHDVDAYLRLFETLHAQQDDMLRVGCALHSLRAVPADAMRDVVAALPGDARIHVHIAEQIGEVQDCLAIRGARPVEWLLANAAVDARWTLVHATHLTPDETRGIAASGATVAICPTTEANLGDGLFPLRDYLGGRWRLGHRFGFAHLGVAGRGTALARIRPAPGDAPSQHRRARRFLQRRRNAAGRLRGQPRQCDRFRCRRRPRRARCRRTRARRRDGRGRHRSLDLQRQPQLVSEVVVNGERVVGDGHHRDREAIALRYHKTIEALLA